MPKLYTSTEGGAHARRQLTICIVGLTAIAFVVGWLLSGNLPRALTDGPLDPPPNASVAGISVPVGQSVTWGGAYLLNNSTRPVEVTNVHLVAGPEVAGADVERIEVLDPASADVGVGVALGDAFETIPARLRHSFEGYRLAPGNYLNILVKIHAVQPGLWSFRAVDVDYVAQGRAYSVRLPQAFNLCVELARDCPTR